MARRQERRFEFAGLAHVAARIFVISAAGIRSILASDPPDAPPSVSVSGISTNSVSVSWTFPEDYDSFKMSYSLNDGASWSSESTVSGPPVQIGPTSPALSQNQKVKVQVKTVLDGDESGATPGTGWTFALPPATLSVTPTINGQGVYSALVSSWTWNPTNNPVLTARIYRLKTGQTSYSPVGVSQGTATSMSDTSQIQDGMRYKYYAVARYGEPSNLVEGPPPGTTPQNGAGYVIKLYSPTGLGAVADSADPAAKILLSWTDKTNNESSYEVELTPVGGSSTTFAVPTPTPGTPTPHYQNVASASLSEATKYAYRVRALQNLDPADTELHSSFTESVSTWTSPKRPTSPSAFAFPGVADSVIAVVWTDQSAAEGGFRIKRDGVEVVTRDPAEGVGLSRSWGNTGLQPNTLYEYTVEAFFDPGDASARRYSAPTAALEAITAPSAPPSISASASGDAAVQVIWMNPASGPDADVIQAEIWRKDGNYTNPFLGGYTYIDTVDVTPATQSDWTDETTTGAKKYTYLVRAVNDANSAPGPYSAGATVTTQGTLPAITSAQPLCEKRIQIGWSAASYYWPVLIQRKPAEAPDEEYATIEDGEVSGETPPIIDSDPNLVAGASYAYRVLASTPDKSNSSPPVQVSVFATLQVASFDAEADYETVPAGVELSWNVQGSNFTSLEILRQGPGESEFQSLGALPEPPIQCDLSSNPPTSGSCTDAGPADLTAPSAPSFSSTVPAANSFAPNGSVTLNWNAASDGSTEYSYKVRALDSVCGTSATSPVVSVEVGGTIGFYRIDFSFTSDPPEEGEVIKSYTINADEPRTLAATGLPDGEVYAHITAYDRGWNPSAPSTAGPWTIDDTPPDAPALVSIEGGSPTDGEEWFFLVDRVGASMDIHGVYPDVWAATPGVTIRAYMRGFRLIFLGGDEEEFEPFEVGSIELEPPQTPGETSFVIEDVSTAEISSGPYLLWLVAEDERNPPNVSGPSHQRIVLLDNDPPVLTGLESIRPPLSDDASAFGTATATWSVATDEQSGIYAYELFSALHPQPINFENPPVALVRVNAQDGLPLAPELLPGYSASARAEAGKVILDLSGIPKAETRTWALRAMDYSGNTAGGEALRTVYGLDSASVTWEEVDPPAPWETRLGLGFTPISGNTAGSQLFVAGSNMDLGAGAGLQSWFSFASEIEPVLLRPLGVTERRLLVQFRDGSAVTSNYSFSIPASITYQEPPVIWAIDLRDAATNVSLPEVTTLASQEARQIRLVAFDQYGVPFSPVEFDDLAAPVVSSSVPEVIGFSLDGDLMDLAGGRIGVAQIEFAHPTDPRLRLARGFHVNAPGPLASIEIAPTEAVRIKSGSAAQFRAKGFDAAMNEVAIDPVWSAGPSGSVNAMGTFRAAITGDEIEDFVRVRDRGQSSVSAEKPILVDGRPPRVNAIVFDPALSPEGEFQEEVTAISLDLPGSAPEWERSAPARHVIYLDGRVIGTIAQLAAGGAPVEDPPLALDPSVLRSGVHTIEVASTDSLGNSNAGAPFKQVVRVANGIPPASAVDWLLTNQNLDRSRPAERGSWTSNGQPPVFEAAAPKETIAAQIAETSAAAITLLGYDLDYMSISSNLSKPGPVTVRESLEAAFVFLFSALSEAAIEDPIAVLQASEALWLAKDSGIQIHSIDWNTGAEISIDGLQLQLSLAEKLGEVLMRAADGGYSRDDARGSSRLATLMALRLGLLARDPSGADDEDEDGGIFGSLSFNLIPPVLDDFYQSSAFLPILHYVGHDRLYPSGASAAITGGIGLGQWDDWNAKRSVLSSAEMLRTLGTVGRMLGSTDQLDALQANLGEFLFELRGVAPSAGQLGFGDPPSQDPSDPSPPEPTIVSTAATLLALQETAFASPEAILEGVQFLRQSKDAGTQSWNERALDTALALRLMRSDLVIAGVDPPIANSATNRLEYPVRLRNDGLETAYAFVVSVHAADPTGLNPAARSPNRAAVSQLIPVLNGEAELTVNIPVASAARTLFFMVDGEGVVAELNESNNVATFNPAQLPDLALVPRKLKFGSYDVQAGFVEGPVVIGQPFAISATVANVGMANAPPGIATVKFYLGDVGSNPFATFLRQFTPEWPAVGGATALRPADEYTVVGVVDQPSPDFAAPGRYQISARIAPGLMDEISDSNNTLVQDLVIHRVLPSGNSPDLAIDGEEAISIVPVYPVFNSAGGEFETPFEFEARIRVKNLGLTPVAQPVVELWVDRASPRRAVLPGVLDAGQTAFYRFPLAATEPGVRLYVVADPDGLVDELTEENNDAERGIGVPAPGSIRDLAVGIYPDDVRARRSADGSWSLDVNVRNMGSSSYAPVPPDPRATLRVTIEGNPARLERLLGSTIQPGQSFTATWDNVPFAMAAAAQPNILKAELINNTPDGTALNDAATRSIRIPDDSYNLALTGLQAQPAIGRITSSAMARLPVEFAVTLHATIPPGKSLEGVDLELRVDATGEVLWARALSELSGTGASTVRIQEVPVPPGQHSISAVIDPQGRVLESNEQDNRAATPVSVEDAAERDLPELHFAEGPILLSVRDGLLSASGRIDNRLADRTPRPTGPFALELQKPDGTVLGSSTLGGLEGGGTAEFVVTAPALSAIGDLLLKIDPANAVAELTPPGKTNNTAAFEIYSVSPPVALAASALFQEVRLEWQDNPEIGQPGKMPLEELAGYRVKRFRAGVLETVYFQEPENPAYLLTDPGLPSGTAYTYEVVTIATSGLESVPVTTAITTTGVPIIKVYQGNRALSSPAQVNARIEGVDDRVRIEVTIPAASQYPPSNPITAELYINGALSDASPSSFNAGANKFTFDPVLLRPGENTFFARARIETGSSLHFGQFSAPFRVTYRTGVDLTASKAEVSFYWRMPDAFGAMMTGNIEEFAINAQAPNLDIVTQAIVHNTETGQVNSGAFTVLYRFHHIDSEMRQGAGQWETEMRVTNGVMHGQPIMTSNGCLIVCPSGMTNEPYGRPEGLFVSKIEIIVDSNDEIIETFEDNNLIELYPLECVTDAEIMLVMDKSYSMTGSRMAAAKEQLRGLVTQKLRTPEHRVGLITFNELATINAPVGVKGAFPLQLFDEGPGGIQASHGTAIHTAFSSLDASGAPTSENNALAYFLGMTGYGGPNGPEYFVFRDSAQPIILLADDAGGIEGDDVEAAAGLKRELAKAFPGLPAIRIYNVHIANAGPAASQWQSANDPMFMRHLTSTIDVKVSKVDGDDDENQFMIYPYGSRHLGPTAFTGVGANRTPVTGNWKVKQSGLSYDGASNAQGGVLFEPSYLVGTTQILTAPSVTESATFSVDRKSRVVVLWPESHANQRPGWLTTDGWYLWDTYSRMGAFGVYPRYGGYDEELLPYQILISGAVHTFQAYCLDLSGEGSQFTLGPGEGKFYTAFVFGDPMGPGAPAGALEPFIRVVTTDQTVFEESMDWFIRDVCFQGLPEDDLLDIKASFYVPPAGEEPPLGDSGFPGGFPVYGAAGRLVGRVANLGGLTAPNVEYRLTADYAPGSQNPLIVDLSGGWKTVPGLPLDVLADERYLPGYMNATIEANWSNTGLPRPDFVQFKLEVRCDGEDSNLLTNNVEYSPIYSNDLASDQLPNFAWAEDFLMNGEPLPTQPGSGLLVVPMRYGADRTLEFEFEILNHNVAYPSVFVSAEGAIEPFAPGGEPYGALISADGPTVQLRGTTPGFVTPYRCAIGISEESLDQWAMDSQPALLTVSATLNQPASGAPVTEVTQDDNEKVVSLPVVLKFQDGAANSAQVAGIDAQGRVRIQAEIERKAEWVNYPFDSVTVGLFEGSHIEQPWDEPMAEVAGQQTRLIWSALDGPTKSVEFLWTPDGRDQVTLVVAVDPYDADLAEHPATGRLNNFAVVHLDSIPGEINLRPENLRIANAAGEPLQLERGRTAEILADALYARTGSEPAAAPATYKARFWDGIPGGPLTRVIGDAAILGQTVNVPATASVEWMTGDLHGVRTLYVELDPKDHLASAANLPASKIPLVADRCWSGASTVVPYLAADDSPDEWIAILYAADPTDPLDAEAWTKIGEWRSDGTPVSGLTPAPSAGPLLLVLQAADANQTSGDEFLPAVAEGDRIEIRLPDPSLTPPDADLPLLVDLPLPAALGGAPQREFALWIAEDGSTYFANSMHLAHDFNFGSSSGTVADMPPQVAMSDPIGRVAEANELDNLTLLQIEIVDPTSLDMAVEALAVAPAPHLQGDIVSVTATLKNRVAAHGRAFELSISRSGGPVLATKTVFAEGGWDNGEVREVTIGIPTAGQASPLSIVASIAFPDEDPANNSKSGQIEFSGSYSVALSAPSPSLLGPLADISFDVDLVSNPALTAGEVYLWIIDAVGNVMDRIEPGSAFPNPVGTGAAEFAWNTGTISPGVYRVRAELADETGESQIVRAVALSAAFEVSHSPLLSAAVLTDRASYRVGDVVRIEAVVSNPPGSPPLAGSIEVSLQLTTFGGAVRWNETETLAGGLGAGASRALTYLVPDLEEQAYDLSVYAEAVENPALVAADRTSFAVGRAGDLPAEIIQFVDCSQFAPLDYANTLELAVSLGNAGGYAMWEDDYVWLSAGDKPMLAPNLAPNADLSSPAGSSPQAAHWYGAPRTWIASGGAGHWALEFSASGTASSMSANAGTFALPQAIRLAPGQDYAFAFDTFQSVGAAPASLTFAVNQFSIAGEPVGEPQEFSVSRGSANPEERVRFEATFKTARLTRFIELVLARALGGDPVYVDSIRLNSGTVASAPRAPSASERVNLLANGSFSVDSGVAFELIHAGDLASMNHEPEDGIPDGWVHAGGGGLAYSQDALPPEALARGSGSAVLLSPAGTSLPRLEQHGILLPSGSTVSASIWAKGKGRLSIHQIDGEGIAIGAPETAAFDETDWSEVTVPAFDLEPETRELAFVIETTDPNRTVTAAAARLATSASWDSEASGWTPYSGDPQNWTVDGQASDGPRFAYGRYLSQFGVLSIDPLSPLTRDADRNGATDAFVGEPPLHAPATITAAARYEDADTSAPLNALNLADLLDADAATAFDLADAYALRLAVDAAEMAYVDSLLLTGELDAPARIRALGSLDDELYLPVWQLDLPAGKLDRLVELRQTWPFWRIVLEAPEAEARLAGTISEIELRGGVNWSGDAIVLDRAAPQFELTPISPNPSSSEDLVLVGALSDSLSGIGELAYRLTPAGGSAGAWTPLPFSRFGAAFEIPVPAPADGHYTIELRAADLAGNTANTSDTVHVDRTAPLIVLNPFTPDPSNAEEHDYSGSAEDETGGSGIVSLKYRIPGAAPTDWTEVPDWSAEAPEFEIAGLQLPEGAHVIEVRGTDAAGNAGGDSDELLVDRTPPVLALAAYSPDPVYAPPQNFTGEVSDALSGVASLEYRVLAPSGAGSWTAVQGFDPEIPEFQLALNLNTVGTHTLEMRATDAAGNMSYDSDELMVIPDSTAPVVSITPYQPDPTNNDPVVWQGTAADAHSGIAAVEVRIDGGSWGPPTSFNPQTGQFSISASGLADGSHEAQARGADMAGISSNTASDSVLIDRTGPVVAISQPANGSWHKGPVRVSWSSSAPDLASTDGRGLWTSLDGLDSEEFEVSNNDDVLIDEGEYDIYAWGIDNLGNIGAEAHVAFSIDLTSPTLAIIQPASGSPLSDVVGIELDVLDEESGPALTGATWEILDDWDDPEPLAFEGITGGTATFEESAFDTWRVPDGEAVLIARARDVAGNVGVTSRTLEINNLYPPQAPTGIEAAYISFTEVRLTWNRNTEPDLSRYRIYRRAAVPAGAIGEGDLIVSWAEPTSGDEPLETHIDMVTTSTASTGYYLYALRAVDDADNLSLWSETLAIPPPDAPAELRAIGRGGEVDLTWVPVEAGYVERYVIFRKAPGESAFSYYASVEGQSADAYTDSDVDDGSLYAYRVYALDGAENSSQSSNIAEAVPGTTSTYQSSMLVMFEGLKNQGNNDWDFEDVGVKMRGTLELNASDQVTTITLDIEGVRAPTTGRESTIYLSIKDFQGTGHYTGQYFDPCGDPISGIGWTTPQEYAWSDEDLWPNSNPVNNTAAFKKKNILLFSHTKTGWDYPCAAGETADKFRLVLTFVVDNPAANPFSTFDKIPFDTWLHVVDGDQVIHVYDPETGDYFDDVNIVQETDAHLGGVAVNTAIAIPKLDWAHLTNTNANGNRMWSFFPDFVEYAKTIRTAAPKNLNWYENYDPTP